MLAKRNSARGWRRVAGPFGVNSWFVGLAALAGLGLSQDGVSAGAPGGILGTGGFVSSATSPRAGGRAPMACAVPSFTGGNFPAGDGPHGVVTADFNHDGKLDIATANDLGNTVSVLLDDGSGGFGVLIDFAAGPNSRSVSVGDFNRDGNLDLVT